MMKKYGRLKLITVAGVMMAVLLTGCNKKSMDHWQAEMNPWASFQEFTYFDGEDQKTIEVYVEHHGGDDTTPYTNANVPKTENTLTFPMPAETIWDGVFWADTWADYEERETGEEILSKPLYDVRVDGDVYDIIAHDYYYDDSSTGKRLHQKYSHKNSKIPMVTIFAQEIDSDVNVHVVYGKDSVVISADKPFEAELTVSSLNDNEKYKQNVTISEKPITVVRSGIDYKVS